MKQTQYYKKTKICFYYTIFGSDNTNQSFDVILVTLQVRVIYSEVGQAQSSASLPGKRLIKGPKHQKSRSMDSFDDINNYAEEEDNFSDTDNEDEWKKEATLVEKEATVVAPTLVAPQTTYV